MVEVYRPAALFLFCFCFVLLDSIVGQDLREPYIRYGPKNTDVSIGGRIKLDCYVYGQPTPTVTWYKNGVAVAETAGVTVEIDKSLVIMTARRDMTHDDSGVYYCVAKNSEGSQQSKNATVTVKYLSNTFIENPGNASVEIYADHVMRCKAPHGYPVPRINWLKDGQSLTFNTFVKETQVNGSSEIKFNQMKWSNRGFYQCEAENTEGKKLSKSAYLNVKVIAPSLYKSKNVIDLYEGDSFTLNCPNKFQPEPTRTWSKTGGTLPPTDRLQYQSEKSILFVSKAKTSDAGEYVCTAKNEAGKDTLEYQVIIYKNVYFEVQPTSLSAGKGQTVKFHCAVKGGKNAKVKWLFDVFYDEKSINSGGRVYMTSDNSFVISNIQENDALKKVRCIGDDGNKREYSTEVELRIIDTADPSPKIKSLSQVEQVEGSKLVLPCSANGPGPLTFEWLTARDNKKVSVGADDVWISKSATSANLTWSDVLVTDGGAYRCKVSGPSGSSTSITTVTIKPSDGDRPPKVPNVKVIKIGATSLTLTWSRPQTALLSPVTSYIITIKNQANQQTYDTTVPGGDTTQRTITSLSPATLYSFSIVANNKKGKGVTTDFPNVETLSGSVTPDPNSNTDRLLDVDLQISISTVTSDSIKIEWNQVAANRITGYIISYRRYPSNSLFLEQNINWKTATTYELRDLLPNTRYQIKIKAVNKDYHSNPSKSVEVTTLRATALAVQNVRVRKITKDSVTVSWEIPDKMELASDITGVLVSLKHFEDVEKKVKVIPVPIEKTIEVIINLDPKERYYVKVGIEIKDGSTIESNDVSFRLSQMNIDEVYPRRPFEPSTPKGDSNKKDEEEGIVAIVKEPWFIATVSVLLWLLLLVIVVLICCRRRNRQSYREPGLYESRGLIGTGTRGMDYPNTSLNRSRMLHPDHKHMRNPAKRKFCSCCRPTRSNSFEDDFPNRADIKPYTGGYVRHDTLEMRMKGVGMDSLMKENNLGIATRNGYKVDVPLNNELDGYRQASIDNRLYHGPDHPRKPLHGSYRDPNIPPHPGSGSMSRRNDSRVKQDSVDRRLGEIVRTKKQVPDDDVNVMDANNQASWKREPKPKEAPPNPVAVKPPGENTLRRQGKTQFKPLPNLEVLKWADGLPNTSQAPSTNGSPPGSPKTTTSASVLSEADNVRSDSRLESHGGSSNSLNKYSYDKRRRRNSNASSMMSSELYQSEMDPSGYSDVAYDRKKRKEKAIPPPIDFDGLTSDILLQWAESVTNSSPSSSGSSSPSRLSGISSEGSLYTDEDFAQAVAAVAECGGFNMDYDYNLPGMNLSQAPLSSTRNSKMDKIDQVFAQRAKSRTPAVGGNKQAPRPDTSTPQNYIPQISMSGYLTGSQRGPQSTHSSSNAPSRSSRSKGAGGEKKKGLYGTGFDDIDSVSTPSTKPLTVSNLMRHDNSLDRDKKESANPLTVSNLRQHDTSLDRERRPKPSAYNKPPPYESLENGYREQMSRSNPLLPEAALSVTSALERHESMNSNSKDSLNSSNKNDSEIENNAGTSERRQQRRTRRSKNNFDPKSSTSTVNTVRTSQSHESDC